ncbi:MAG: hypothetical protein GY906_09830 [bacterium]|nr:hypothetical protein [bacterium]
MRVYVSRGWKGSLGQEYRLCSDHIELRFGLLLKTYTIPLTDVERIQVVDGGLALITDVFRGATSFMSIFWVLVLDTAAFRRHVLLETRSGSLRFFRFTPENPEAFVAAVESALS